MALQSEEHIVLPQSLLFLVMEAHQSNTKMVSMDHARQHTQPMRHGVRHEMRRQIFHVWRFGQYFGRIYGHPNRRLMVSRPLQTPPRLGFYKLLLQLATVY